MIFRVSLKCQNISYGKTDFYYSILGAFLNSVKNDTQIYENLTKLDFHQKDDFLIINAYIFGKQNFDKLISRLLETKNLTISIDGEKFLLSQIDLGHQFFDINSNYKLPKSFYLQFLSPTFVRQENTIFLIPSLERFFGSSLEKLKKLYPELENIDKKFLKGLYSGEYKLYSQQLKIKKATKSGARGYIKVYTDQLDEQYKPIFAKLLAGTRFVGMGSGTKLGLGNVNIKF